MSVGARVDAVTSVAPLQLGEGPHWVDEEQSLYFVDLLKGCLHRLDTTSQRHTCTTPAGGRSLSLVVPVSGRKNFHVVGHGRDLSVLEWDGVSQESAIKRVLATVEADVQERGQTRFNDGKADPTGRLWAGTMSTAVDVGAQDIPHHGNLYSLEDGGGRVQRRATDIDISNGLAWAGNHFYYVDSLTKRVDVFDFDPITGNVENRRCAFDFVKNDVGGVPDGMTIDTSGNLWVATFGGSGQLVCVDPNAGKEVTHVTLPVLQVTSAAWGGRGLDELYVTSASMGTQQGQPQAGALFRITGLGAKGTPATEVRLGNKILEQI